MKRLLYFLFLFSAVACVSNGLNKPITQELTPEEIRANLKKNPSFDYTYTNISDLRNWILEDNLRQAKYGQFTYKQLIDYWSCGPRLEEVDAEHLRMYPNRVELRAQADSLIEYYRGMKPDSLLMITFDKKTTCRTWLGNYPEFHFTVTPLKGTVEQFNFDYYFYRKIEGERSISDIPFSLLRHGYQRSPVSKESTLKFSGDLWTDTLEDVSDEELHRDFTFIYSITNVRYNGQNWDDIPYMIQLYINGVYKDDDNAKDMVIQKMILPEYVTASDLLLRMHTEAAKQQYPDIFAMFEQYEPLYGKVAE